MPLEIAAGLQPWSRHGRLGHEEDRAAPRGGYFVKIANHAPGSVAQSLASHMTTSVALVGGGTASGCGCANLDAGPGATTDAGPRNVRPPLARAPR